MEKSENNWHAQETYRSMMEFGRGMLRFTFLANGGAIIALLTFLGDLYSKNTSVPGMKIPLIAFLSGLLLGGIAAMTTYFTQYMLFNESIKDIDAEGLNSHLVWFRITIFLITLSILAFALGAFMAVARLQ